VGFKFNSPAEGRFNDRMLFIMMPIFTAVVFLGWWGFGYHHFHPTGILAYLCAAYISLISIVPIILVGLYIAEEKDDFLRTVYIQSMLWGIGATLIVTTFWGFLETLDLVPHENPVYVFTLFAFFMAVARALVKWRYR
jgi:hypothetical protein